MTSPTREITPLDAWTGAFGDAYTERNVADEAHIERRIDMWRRVLRPLSTKPPKSCLEAGANIGINLRALRMLSAIEMHAIEPNAKAREILIQDRVVPANHVLDGTVSRIDLADESIDLVFTSGVLIHVDPEHLQAACREMHRVARHYLLTIEYFASEPETKTYRGRKGFLFKRDFGALWLDLFPTLNSGRLRVLLEARDRSRQSDLVAIRKALTRMRYAYPPRILGLFPTRAGSTRLARIGSIGHGQ